MYSRFRIWFVIAFTGWVYLKIFYAAPQVFRIMSDSKLAYDLVILKKLVKDTIPVQQEHIFKNPG